jgi:ATP-dependent DNA helicase RecG
MKLVDLRKLIINGESEILEFKKSTAQLQAAMQTACAFLNGRQGGHVLIGVSDNGSILGQKISDKTKKEISVEINKIEPHVKLEVDFIKIKEEHFVIVITVPKKNKAPYMYDGRSFLRNQSTTMRMPHEQYENLLYTRKSNSIGWENLFSNECDLKDLAGKASIKEILTKLKLMIGGRLTNAATILFCKNDQKQFIQSCLRLARFRGIDKKEFIDNKSIEGNAFDLYDRAIEFLQNYLPLSGKIEPESSRRVEQLAIPPIVLREALVNALSHRDYASAGGSVSVAIYDDRVEIINSGRLPPDIHLRDLSKIHESHPRNPLICSIFYIAKMIERWGRGTQDMIGFCKDAGNPEPEFIETTGSFGVIFRLRELIANNKQKIAINLTERQIEILAILKKKNCTTSEMMTFLKRPPSRRMLQIDLTLLEKSGLIQRQGESRTTIWRFIKE